MTDKKPAKPVKTEKQIREERLRKQLRQNLQRRKAKARALKNDDRES